MTDLILREWNDCKIRQREDGYLSATDMAKANNKLVGHWLELKSTNEFINTMSSVIGIPITELLQSFQGGNPSEQGTWLHPQVAPDFAAWCSTRFRVQVSLWIHELLSRGTVSIGEPETPKVRQFSVNELNAMIKQVDLMSKLKSKGQKQLAHVILNELEMQWGVEPTVYESPSDLPASSNTNTDYGHDWDWFLDSEAPDTPWHAPSGKKIPITDLYNSYREYCFRRNITPHMRKVFSKCLASLGAERIESNRIYWILPNRPE